MAVKKNSGKSPTSAKTGRERRIPQQRERCQTGFDLLRSLLDRAGRGDILEKLKGLEGVDDVLRHQPAFLPVLLNAAWELRVEPRFSDLFRNGETGEIVQARDEPIAPCGRTYAHIVQSHLYGAARLYFERLEKDWAAKRAREAEKKWKKQQASKRSTLTGRLTEGLRDLTGAPRSFDLQDFRADYSGFGLYEALKPHLSEEWQFRLVPLYARMTTRQAQAFDDLILYFRTPDELELALSLGTEDVSRARQCARTYAEAFLNISISGYGHRPRPDDDPEEMAARRDAALKEERRVFDLLLTRFVHCLEPLKEMGSKAETVLRRLTPVFGEEVWSLVADDKALTNAINCPDFLLSVLGVSCRALPPEIGAALGQIQDRILTRDLLEMAMERFPRDELERYLADPKRKVIWNQLPAKFNNSYSYQPDAPSDNATVKNHENLRMVAEGIFTSLQKGTPEAASS